MSVLPKLSDIRVEISVIILSHAITTKSISLHISMNCRRENIELGRVVKTFTEFYAIMKTADLVDRFLCQVHTMHLASGFHVENFLSVILSHTLSYNLKYIRLQSDCLFAIPGLNWPTQLSFSWSFGGLEVHYNHLPVHTPIRLSICPSSSKTLKT